MRYYSDSIFNHQTYFVSVFFLLCLTRSSLNFNTIESGQTLRMIASFRRYSENCANETNDAKKCEINENWNQNHSINKRGPNQTFGVKRNSKSEIFFYFYSTGCCCFSSFLIFFFERNVAQIRNGIKSLLQTDRQNQFNQYSSDFLLFHFFSFCYCCCFLFSTWEIENVANNNNLMDRSHNHGSCLRRLMWCLWIPVLITFIEFLMEGNFLKRLSARHEQWSFDGNCFVSFSLSLSMWCGRASKNRKIFLFSLNFSFYPFLAQFEREWFWLQLQANHFSFTGSDFFV